MNRICAYIIADWLYISINLSIKYVLAWIKVIVHVSNRMCRNVACVTSWRVHYADTNSSIMSRYPNSLISGLLYHVYRISSLVNMLGKVDTLPWISSLPGMSCLDCLYYAAGLLLLHILKVFIFTDIACHVVYMPWLHLLTSTEPANIQEIR